MKRNEPELWAQCKHVLLPHNYVNWWLTGAYAAEAGDASGIGVFVPGGAATATPAYDAERCADVDERFAAMLPPLVAPNAIVGQCRAEALRALGLPAGATVVVSAGSGDNMCSALGAGAAVPGKLVMSLGTSGTLFGVSETAVDDPTGAVAPFRDATGHHLPLVCIQNCTSCINEVAEAFGMSHDELTALAEREPAGCHGVTFLPYLTGERTPNWPHATGALLGLGPGGLRPGRVYRAAMEGVCFAMLAGYKRMQALGMHASELRLVGGGSSNRLWRRIIELRTSCCDSTAVVLGSADGNFQRVSERWILEGWSRFAARHQPRFAESGQETHSTHRPRRWPRPGSSRLWCDV